MEYLPLALLVFVYVAARQLRSFKVEVTFKDDGGRSLRGERNLERLPPSDERERLLEESGGQRRRRRRR